MERLLLPTLRFAGIAVLAYLVVAGMQALVLEVALNGEVEPGAPLAVLVFGTAGTICSGYVGGWLAACLGKAQPLRHAAGVVLLLAADAVYVVTSSDGKDPVWWLLGGALTISTAAAVGGWMRQRTVLHRR